MPDHEIRSVLSFCHDQACGGHFSGKKKLQLKSFNVVFIGQLCFGIRLSTVNIVLDANSWVGLVEGT